MSLADMKVELLGIAKNMKLVSVLAGKRNFVGAHKLANSMIPQMMDLNDEWLGKRLGCNGFVNFDDMTRIKGKPLSIGEQVEQVARVIGQRDITRTHKKFSCDVASAAYNLFNITMQRTIELNDKLREKSTLGLQLVQGTNKTASFNIPEMVDVPGGTFKMGNTQYPNQQPIRQVKISDFNCSIHLVSWFQYRTYLKATKRDIRPNSDIKFRGEGSKPGFPVSWHDATAYCGWLKEKTGREIRLLTEAEREYIERGGPLNNSDFRSWCGVYGLFNESGFEWTGDWYADKYDPKDLIDPKGPKTGTMKVARGIYFDPDTTKRWGFEPGSYDNYIYGFRLAEGV